MIERLRQQAAKARRLANVSTDRMTRDVLLHYAQECDDEADRLETLWDKPA